MIELNFTYRELEEHDWHQIVANHDDMEIGWLTYSLFPGIIRLEWVNVLEDFQRQGIATALMEECRRRHPDLHGGPVTMSADGMALKAAIWDRLAPAEGEEMRYP